MFTIRRLSAAVTGLAAVVAFAAPAIAARSGNFDTVVGPSSAQFISGHWSFDPWPCTRACAGGMNSGFNYWGYLKDNAADGDWVYTRGKIDGYGWAGGASAENHGGYPTRKLVSQKVYMYDPAQVGKIQVCRHRYGFFPNVCKESAWKKR